MFELLKTLVEFPTISTDQAVNSQALDFIDDYLQKRGMHIVRHEWGGYGSLVATTKPRVTNPAVMFTAHLDVVPGPDECFTLKKEGSRLYGRGVFDMKFAIAAYMQLVDDLKDDLSNHDFGIMIVTDEEIGGANGMPKLLEVGYRPQVFVLPDGGDNWQIETFAKGSLPVQIETFGLSAHASRPWEGDSASFKLINIINELREHYDQQPTGDTFNVAYLECGEDKIVHNKIPDHATATLDFRLMTQESLVATQVRLQQLCNKYNAKLTQLSFGQVVTNDISNPYIAQFIDSVETITGVTCEGTMSYGASDARYIAAYDIACVIVRPHGGSLHAPTEWIDEEGFYQLKDVLLDYLNRTTNISVSIAEPEPQEVLTTAQ